MLLRRILGLTLLLGMAPAGLAESLWLGRFSDGDSAIPEPWKIEQINKKRPLTHYAIRRWDGVVAIEAHASKSMALLTRTATVDLQKTPFLCWQWRVDAPVATADMNKRSGDDYAARVYLTFTVPPERLGFSTRTKLALARTIFGNQTPDAALNYIWDNTHPIGTLQDNAFTDRVRMWVLRSGSGKAGGWVQERRNVEQDIERAFGDFGGQINGLAIATDTDNTGEEAHAGFADFRFVTKEEECPAPSKE